MYYYNISRIILFGTDLYKKLVIYAITAFGKKAVTLLILCGQWSDTVEHYYCGHYSPAPETVNITENYNVQPETVIMKWCNGQRV